MGAVDALGTKRVGDERAVESLTNRMKPECAHWCSMPSLFDLVGGGDRDIYLRV